MNILHLSPYLPSLEANHAGGLCMGKQIETLSQTHQVHVLSFIVTAHDDKLANTILKISDNYTLIRLTKIQKIVNVICHFWLPAYFSTRSSFRFKRQLLHIIKDKKIDAIHAEYASMGQYIWIKKRFPHLIFNLIEHDFTEQSYHRKLLNEHSILKKLFYKTQLYLIHYWEKRFCKKADHVLTFSEKDKRLITDHYNLKNVIVLNPYFGTEQAPFLNMTHVIPDSICFVGQMGRSENHEAALRLIKIGNKLKTRIPNLQIYIIGNNPHESLKKLNNKWIHITGFVEDIDSEIQKCQLGVFPLETGAGIKLKVLKCLALGLPVITTDIGAEGIDEEGNILQLAKSDSDFENRIFELLTNTTLYLNRLETSYNFMSQNFRWSKSERLLSSLYSQTIS